MVKAMKNQRGLTLVELLAVIVILGIVAAIAVPAIGGVIERSKKNADAATIDLVKDAIVRKAITEEASTSTTTIAISTLTGTEAYLNELPKLQSTSTIAINSYWIVKTGNSYTAHLSSQAAGSAIPSIEIKINSTTKAVEES